MSNMVKKTEILGDIYLTQRVITREYANALFEAICEELAVELFKDEPEASKFYRDLPYNLKELPKRPGFDNDPMKQSRVSEMIEDEKDIVIGIYLGPQQNHKILYRKHLYKNMLSVYDEVYGSNSTSSNPTPPPSASTLYGLKFMW